MKPEDLVDQLLSEKIRLDPNDPLVTKIETIVQNYIGDVVGEETTEDEAREECWTLAIDAANERIRDRDLAIAVASEVCHRMGYTPKGYKPSYKKQKPAQPVWPPRTSSDPVPEEPERVVKPTGVVHGHYRPSFLYPQG